MSSLLPDRRQVNVRQQFEFALAEAHAALVSALGARMSRLLAKDLDELLGRERYERRGHVPLDVEGGECHRCHSRESRRFSRHGGRLRTATTRWGDLQIRWPRARCVCGGCVKLNLAGWLAAYQRLDDEVDALIQRWGGLSLSLRQMQQELKHTYIGPVALRTLNRRLHQLQELTPEVAGQDGPPIVELDGFYVTQLRPNGEVRVDAQGRKRPVKGRFKRCVLVALGIWPESGRQEVLAWDLVEAEDTFAWLHFLTTLEAQGISVPNGLRVLIHDGSAALQAVLDFLNLGVAHQRCLFHKLKNILQALQVPEGLTKQERWQRRKTMLKDFQAIWQAKEYATALRRYLRVYRQYRDLQPEAVATLRRDFRSTLTFYRMRQEHPTWPWHFLRTTSHLERFNRRLRKRVRSAGAYHSDAGLNAMLAQTADQAFRPGRRSAQLRHTVPTT
jgi:hypothetical protein